MNLTPTQKADELIEKFKSVETAILVVDEIIEYIKELGQSFYTKSGTNSYEARCINYDMGNYFKEVKQILTDRLWHTN